VPWVIPREFIALYPPLEEIPLAADTHVPVDMPDIACE